MNDSLTGSACRLTAEVDSARFAEEELEGESDGWSRVDDEAKRRRKMDAMVIVNADVEQRGENSVERKERRRGGGEPIVDLAIQVLTNTNTIYNSYSYFISISGFVMQLELTKLRASRSPRPLAAASASVPSYRSQCSRV